MDKILKFKFDIEGLYSSDKGFLNKKCFEDFATIKKKITDLMGKDYYIESNTLLNDDVSLCCKNNTADEVYIHPTAICGVINQEGFVKLSKVCDRINELFSNYKIVFISKRGAVYTDSSEEFSNFLDAHKEELLLKYCNYKYIPENIFSVTVELPLKTYSFVKKYIPIHQKQEKILFDKLTKWRSE